MQNVVVITADDLSYFAMGLSGIEYPKATNFTDALASEGYCFANAYSNIAICEASRAVLMTGLYPQNNGSLAFNPIKEGIATLPRILKEHGFKNCILGKEGHYRHHTSYNWDGWIPACNLGDGCDPQLYADNIRLFLNEHPGKPCFIHANSHEPHRPFIDSIYDHELVKLPDFLPRNEVITGDICRYYTHVNKFDQMVEAVVETIRESGRPTLIVITSDHGMSFPFCKGNCYNFSNNVPMIFVGPNVVKRFDKINVVSHVDFMRTILEYLGIKRPDIAQDGFSYHKLLLGEEERFERQYAYMQMNKFIEDRSKFHCRSIADLNWCYAYNFTVWHPIWEVDGWGWGRVVESMSEEQRLDFQQRPRKELLNIKRNRLSRYNMIGLREDVAARMHRQLMQMMNDYNDVLVEPVRSISVL